MTKSEVKSIIQLESGINNKHLEKDAGPRLQETLYPMQFISNSKRHLKRVSVMTPRMNQKIVIKRVKKSRQFKGFRARAMNLNRVIKIVM